MTLRIIIGFTILAFVSRFWNIGAADFVVWDEAHFGRSKFGRVDGTAVIVASTICSFFTGKFAAYYLRRSFYVGKIVRETDHC